MAAAVEKNLLHDALGALFGKQTHIAPASAYVAAVPADVGAPAGLPPAVAVAAASVRKRKLQELYETSEAAIAAAVAAGAAPPAPIVTHAEMGATIVQADQVAASVWFAAAVAPALAAAIAPLTAAVTNIHTRQCNKVALRTGPAAALPSSEGGRWHTGCWATDARWSTGTIACCRCSWSNATSRTSVSCHEHGPNGYVPRGHPRDCPMV
eukprot:TRINITY_DN1047_c1_g1_i5.p1 TRINITY_DN1047_c1_g1~~TRINITY_DN1047_c1_g1_i5.p1  ORF type:complete len:210 (-),score=15.01 TRINITY_DN1047_c1_g1_i5:156-785(-)